MSTTPLAGSEAGRPSRGAGLRLAATRVGRPLLLVLALGAMGVARSAPVPVFLLLLAAIVAALYLVTRGSPFRWWAAYFAGFGLFAVLRTLADETPIPWQYAYVVDLDRLGGSIEAPTVWLQDRLHDPARAGLADRLAYAVYLSYFAVPHFAAAVIWTRARARFPRYVLAMLATYFLGLAGSFLLPTAPPWLAAQQGHLPHVHRIVIDLTSGAGAEVSEAGYALAGSNVVAAMPSLHTAVTVTLAIFLTQAGRRIGILGWAYAAAMGFALVYLGEHYLVDVVAGFATAALAWRLARVAERRFAARPREASEADPPSASPINSGRRAA